MVIGESNEKVRTELARFLPKRQSVEIEELAADTYVLTVASGSGGSQAVTLPGEQHP